MARSRREPETPEEIPAWFMTYSDVITLLMTFFILLLTFASSEPEKFERLQISLFGGAGATGVAGDPTDFERDSMILRERPTASRLTIRGSQMPPIHNDPDLSSVGQGLAGLTEEEERPTAERFVMQLRRNLLFDDGRLTNRGRQLLRMLAAQLNTLPLDVVFVFPRTAQRTEALTMALHLVREHGVLPGRIAVAHNPEEAGDSQIISAIVIRQVNYR